MRPLFVALLALTMFAHPSLAADGDTAPTPPAADASAAAAPVTSAPLAAAPVVPPPAAPLPAAPAPRTEAPVADAPVVLADDASFDAAFQCPETFRSADLRLEEFQRYVAWAKEAHPDWNLRKRMNVRYGLLRRHGCTATLANIAGSTRPPFAP